MAGIGKLPDHAFDFFEYATYVPGRKTQGSPDEYKRHKTLGHARGAISNGRNVHRKPQGVIYRWVGGLEGEWVEHERIDM